jgi:Domain of unknown function (DUF4397)
MFLSPAYFLDLYEDCRFLHPNSPRNYANVESPYKILQTPVKPGITIFASHAFNQNYILENAMLRCFKAVSVILTLAAVNLIATSCGSGGSAQVRVINAMSNDQSALDVDFNSAKVITALAYGSVYPAQATPAAYLGVPSGSDTIEVLNTGQTAGPIITTTKSFSGGTPYTMLLAGTLNGPGGNAPTAYVLSDDNTAPTTNTVKFRVIDASVSTQPAGGFNVYIYQTGTQLPTTPTINGLVLGQDGAGYVSLPQEPSYTVTLAYPNGTPILNQTYPQGTAQITTLVIIDNSTGSGIEGIPIEMVDLN